MEYIDSLDEVSPTNEVLRNRWKILLSNLPGERPEERYARSILTPSGDRFWYDLKPSIDNLVTVLSAAYGVDFSSFPRRGRLLEVQRYLGVVIHPFLILDSEMGGKVVFHLSEQELTLDILEGKHCTASLTTQTGEITGIFRELFQSKGLGDETARWPQLVAHVGAEPRWSSFSAFTLVERLPLESADQIFHYIRTVFENRLVPYYRFAFDYLRKLPLDSFRVPELCQLLVEYPPEGFASEVEEVRQRIIASNGSVAAFVSDLLQGGQNFSEQFLWGKTPVETYPHRTAILVERFLNRDPSHRKFRLGWEAHLMQQHYIAAEDIELLFDALKIHEGTDPEFESAILRVLSAFSRGYPKIRDRLR